MSEGWGQEERGIRFGLSGPGTVTLGGSVVLKLRCENTSSGHQYVFGFKEGYPRSLRISPPKPDRPFIRISWADTRVLHPPEGFVRLGPGETAETVLDVSFAFERQGVGIWKIGFGYDAVRASGGIVPYSLEEPRATSTTLAQLVVTPPPSLLAAGLSPQVEEELDDALMKGGYDLFDAIQKHSPGALPFVARRVARIEHPGSASLLGWRAFEAVVGIGEPALEPLITAVREIPTAANAFAFTESVVRHRLGQAPPTQRLPFALLLEQIAAQSEMRGNLLISFTACDSSVHGTRQLQVLGTGDRMVTIRPPGGEFAVTQRSRLASGELEALLNQMHEIGVWLLRPLRSHGLPDEPRPHLDIQLNLGEPYSHQVSLWNGEWQNGPARALFAELNRLMTDALPDTRRTSLKPF